MKELEEKQKWEKYSSAQKEVKVVWTARIIMRRDEEYMRKRMMIMDVEGRRRKERPKRKGKCKLEGEGTVGGGDA